jgi:hypothetical protein
MHPDKYNLSRRFLVQLKAAQEAAKKAAKAP